MSSVPPLREPWTEYAPAAGLLIAYTAAMFILYTTAPVIYRLASSVFYNLNLLSANFFGLLFGKQTPLLPRSQHSDRHIRSILIRTSISSAQVPDFLVTRWDTALPAILVVLCGVRRHHFRLGLLFLVYHT